MLSNGHGEDAVGARLARSLAKLAPHVRVTAFPTVGEGSAYAQSGAVRSGPLRALPSGGRTAETLSAAARDVAAGFVGMTASQVRDLRAVRCDVVLVVGDVWAAALGTLPRARTRAWLQTLVSSRMDDGTIALGRKAFRERFTTVERFLMASAFAAVYARDPESAAYLVRRGVPSATFLGNPMMDELDAAPLDVPSVGPRVVLLPGTRSFAGEALLTMLDVIQAIPGLTAVVPWAGGPFPTLPASWRPAIDDATWVCGDVTLHRSTQFAASLAWADVALGTAGTAHEQAVGMGVPVIAAPFGDTYPLAYLRNQQRLLGSSVEIVERDVVRWRDALAGTLADRDERARRAAEGRARMGPPGGSDAIVRDVLRVSRARAVAA